MIAIIGLVVLVAAVAVGMAGVLSTGTPGSGRRYPFGRRPASVQPAEAANGDAVGDVGAGEGPADTRTLVLSLPGC
jgi:hypothetical protein